MSLRSASRPLIGKKQRYNSVGINLSFSSVLYHAGFLQSTVLVKMPGRPEKGLRKQSPIPPPAHTMKRGGM